MGIGTHRRQAHQMIIKTVIRDHTQSIHTKIKHGNNEDTDKIISLKNSTPNTSSLNQKNEYLAQNNNPTDNCQCTETDLWILLARLNQISQPSDTFLGVLNSSFTISELIRDFEHRFECTFNETKKAFPGVQHGKDEAGNLAITKRYAHLKYSR